MLLPYLNDSEHDIKTELGQLIEENVDSLSEKMKEHRNQTATELADILHIQSSSAHDSLTQEISTMIDPISTTLISVTTDLSCVKTDLSHVSDAVSDLSRDLDQHSLQISREIQSFHQSSTEQLTQLSVKMDTLQSTLDSVDTTMTEEFMSLDTQVGATISSELIPLETELDSLNTIIDDINLVKTELSEINDTTSKIYDKLNNLAVYTCGGTGGWRRAVYLNMTDLNTNCPPGWNETDYSKRTCGRATDRHYTCNSAFFPVSGGEYSQVCGKIKAYQYALTTGFYGNSVGRSSINEAYFSGVAVMHGSPRQHIWTFAAGGAEGDTRLRYTDCPCDTSANIPIPPFVGSAYFCESGNIYPGFINYVFHPDDPLWDGDGCISTSTCCSLNNPLYFTKTLATLTTDDLELRPVLLPIFRI